MSDVSITPAYISKSIPIKWTNPTLPICTYPSTNIINGQYGDRTNNISPFVNNQIGVTISIDAPLSFRKETAEFFPTQFEIDELKEALRSNVDMTGWSLLIYETPTVSEVWLKFLTDYFNSGRNFRSVTVGLIQTPEVAMNFVNKATSIIIGNDYTDPYRIYNFPIASLIMNTLELRSKFPNMYHPSIIAMDEELECDEGILKALVLGADSVMLAKSMIKASECAGEVFKYDSGINELIRFTEDELPPGIINTLNTSSLKRYQPYRYINEGKAYEVSYSLAEFTDHVRKNLNEILSITGSLNLIQLRNNMNVII